MTTTDTSPAPMAAALDGLAQGRSMTTNPAQAPETGPAADLRTAPEQALVRAARNLALLAHRGQKDAQGRDYHDAHLLPIASALAIFGPDAEAAGWLHDIIEDTSISAYTLLSEGFPVEVIEAVAAVSRITGETYGALIYRSATHSVLSCRVKLADNTWNILSNTGLRDSDPVRASSLLETRYLPARKVLLAHCDLNAAQIAQMEGALHAHLARLNTPTGPSADPRATYLKAVAAS